MKGPRKKRHRLLIKSLRDLDATCQCGGWSLVAPTFDSQTDEEIKERAWHQYRLHREGVAWHQRKGELRGPIED